MRRTLFGAGYTALLAAVVVTAGLVAYAACAPAEQSRRPPPQPPPSVALPTTEPRAAPTAASSAAEASWQMILEVGGVRVYRIYDRGAVLYVVESTTAGGSVAVAVR